MIRDYFVFIEINNSITINQQQWQSYVHSVYIVKKIYDIFYEINEHFLRLIN